MTLWTKTSIKRGVTPDRTLKETIPTANRCTFCRCLLTRNLNVFSQQMRTSSGRRSKFRSLAFEGLALFDGNSPMRQAEISDWHNECKEPVVFLRQYVRLEDRDSCLRGETYESE